MIPYDRNVLPPGQADLQIDGQDTDFVDITTKSGFVGYQRMMVEKDGKVIFDKLVINPSEGVFVLPVRINPQGMAEFLLVNEWKDVLGKRIAQIPQGGIRDGEKKSDAARREVKEETGYEPESLVLVGRQIFDTAYMSLEQPFYIGVVPYEQERRELELESGEDIVNLPWMRPEEIRRLPNTDGKTTIGIALAERVLNPSIL